MKQISIFQFVQNIDKAVIQFAEAIAPESDEEVQLRPEQDWWEEFKLYMEEL